MGRVVIALLLAAGCGRFGFEQAPPDEAAPGDGPLDPDLVVWLPLDGDPGADTLDELGTLGPGKCIDGCPLSVAGRIGKAYDFDAEGGAIRFDSVPALDFSMRGLPMSIAMWYRSRNVAGVVQQVLVAKAIAGGQVSYQLALEDLRAEGKLGMVWKVCVGDCSGEDFAFVSGGAEQDVWRLVVGVWTGTGSELYVDAVLRSSFAKPSFSFEADQPFVIGADAEPGGFQDIFNGQLDDVRIYKRALSVADQQALLAQ